MKSHIPQLHFLHLFSPLLLPSTVISFIEQKHILSIIELYIDFLLAIYSLFAVYVLAFLLCVLYMCNVYTYTLESIECYWKNHILVLLLLFFLHFLCLGVHC